MKTYRIANKTSGHDFGTYTAKSPLHAIELLTKDAGYRSMKDAAEVCGQTVLEYVESLSVEEADDFGTLTDADTKEEIGPATKEQREASDKATPTGCFTIDADTGEVLRESEADEARLHRGVTLRTVYVQP